MPTPDGREWLTPREIIRQQLEQVYRDRPNVNRTQMENLKDSLVEGFLNTGWGIEIKVLRLAEKLKEAVDEGRYGPLRDGDGNPTAVGEIAADFKRIYTIMVLDQFDDEGNLKDPSNG